MSSLGPEVHVRQVNLHTADNGWHAEAYNVATVLAYMCESEAAFDSLVKKSVAFIALAKARDEYEEVVGLGLCEIDNSRVFTTAELHLLSVREDQQRKGIGSLLLGHIEQYAAQQGCRGLLLTSSDTQQAFGFYRSRGYAPTAGSRFGKMLPQESRQ